MVPVGDWRSLIEAARYLGIARAAVDRLVMAGRLGYRRLPGTAPRVFWPDVERLAAEHTRPAVTDPAR